MGGDIDRTINIVWDTGLMSKWKEIDQEYILEERKKWERESNQKKITYKRK